MGIIGKAGFVFSFDLAIAFIAMLLMLSLMLAHFGFGKEQALETFGEISLQRKAVFLIDSMVKNRDEKQPLLGSAVFDGKKRRVLQNGLDLELLEKAGGFRRGTFFVSQVSVSGQRLFFEESGERCLTLDRLVLVQGSLEKLVVVACEK
jgi:hypothetical protein